MSDAGDDPANGVESENEAADSDAEPDEYDPTDIDPSSITPMAGLIVVAFTGAVIGLVGAAVSFFTADLGLALVGVGVVVALSSPIAYLRLRRRYGS
ncbi:hypothetical protein [Halorubrum sp. BV1]|uniref:hypothetical protein n=1 Tax=Halorubrum sp. BV1 TaxID=1498500 RepID=UPI0006786E94|nr:hypothetical protein [Halorubrum sp. BV1]